MAWQPPKGMDEYLKPTELCDCDNAELQEKAKGIIKGAETPKEAALRVFQFVRDEIPWMLDAYDLKASRTLKKRKGHGINKANLQVALLRAVGIPARYHQRKEKREWLKGLVSSSVYNRVPEILSSACYCECYLSQRWVGCDPCFDKPLYEGMLRAGSVTKEQIPTIDWDGERDLDPGIAWMAEDIGAFPCLDDVFRKAEKEQAPRIFAQTLGRFFIFLSNRHTDRLRKGKK